MSKIFSSDEIDLEIQRLETELNAINNLWNKINDQSFFLAKRIGDLRKLKRSIESEGKLP